METAIPITPEMVGRLMETKSNLTSAMQSFIHASGQAHETNRLLVAENCRLSAALIEQAEVIRQLEAEVERLRAEGCPPRPSVDHGARPRPVLRLV